MGAQINTNQGRSRGRQRRSFRPSSDINVTPLVDVMLVLLVIFMVTAPMLTVGVPVDLPKTQAAKMNDNADPLVISVNAEGRIFVQETELTQDDLVPRLMAITGSNPDAKVYVRGDEKLAYGKVMETMGLIAAAGFSKVSLIAEMPNGPVKSLPKVAAPAVKHPMPPKLQHLPPMSAPQMPRPIAPQHGRHQPPVPHNVPHIPMPQHRVNTPSMPLGTAPLVRPQQPMPGVQ